MSLLRLASFLGLSVSKSRMLKFGISIDMCHKFSSTILYVGGVAARAFLCPGNIRHLFSLVECGGRDPAWIDPGTALDDTKRD